MAHFTAGGHFPSLLPEKTLELLPALDSIVRFEGEITLLELIQNLDHPELWKQIPGLAFRNSTETIISEVRPLIPELDSLPLLFRDEEPKQMGKGIKMASMLASRGCLHNCSFCSIRQFYGIPDGQLRRVRSPQAVVEEMLNLYAEKGVRFFSFQDDDFTTQSIAQQKWVKAFLKELEKAGLERKIAWKVSCRVDDLEPNLLGMMVSHGLIAVYLGVESGNDIGLQTLNKHASVEQNITAINLLKEYQLAMSIGFMLFDPSSTIETVRQNIAFLQNVGADGYFPINFCKMLPYAGTPIEAKLRNEGRLQDTVVQPDYGFHDPILDWYEFLIKQVFSRRNFSNTGIVSLLQQADFNWHLASYFNSIPIQADWKQVLQQMIRDTNMLAIKTLESLLEDIIRYGIDFLLQEQQERIVTLFEQEWRGEMQAEVQLEKLRATWNCD